MRAGGQNFEKGQNKNTRIYTKMRKIETKWKALQSTC